MEKIKLNDYQTIFYFVWNNSEETIKMVNEYLKITKSDNWSCGRCWDEETKSNTSDTFISKKGNTINSFYYLDEYVVDFINCFLGLKKEDFDKGDFIQKWKQNRKINEN
jgi:hypothetical protein